MSASTRSLTAEESDRVRAALEIVRRELKTQQKIAKALGIAQSAVSNASQPGNLVGPKTARAVARYLGMTFDELVNGKSESYARELRFVAGFDDALAEAIRRVPGMADELRALATDRTNREVLRVTPETLIALALAWAQAPKGD